MFAPADVPLHEPVTVAMDTADPVDRPFVLQEGLCYTFLAAADASAGPVALALLEPAGRVVASDHGENAVPTIQDVCPEHSGTWTLRVSTRQPPALAVVGGFRVTERDRRSVVAELDALAALHAPDLRPWSPVHTETLTEGERFSTPVLLEAGRCYAFLAVGPPPAANSPAADPNDTVPAPDLDAILYSPDGLRFKQDIGVDRTPVIHDVCPVATGGWRYTLHAYRGSGDVHWQIRASDPAP